MNVRKELASERRANARIEHGGAVALAKAVVALLAPFDATTADLQTAAHLLGQASKLADHAALQLRLADDGDVQEDGEDA